MDKVRKRSGMPGVRVLNEDGSADAGKHADSQHRAAIPFLGFLFAAGTQQRQMPTMEQRRANANHATELSKELRVKVLNVYGKFLSDDGSSVDYVALRSSKQFEEYLHAARRLRDVDLGALERSEFIALVLNLYNAMVIHGLAVAHKQPSNIVQRLRFYNKVVYRIGPHAYSVNDLENGLLRGNRKGAAPLSRPPFGKGDPRASYALSDPDERIHFALNCGAKSCPSIRYYSPESLDAELRTAAQQFILDDSNVKIRPSDDSAKCATSKAEHPPRVELSSIFDWYRPDFTGSDTSDKALLLRIAKYLDESEPLRSRLEAAALAGASVVFATYDWDVNDVSEN
ncbi:hypothetical protein FVE85_2380 [Porphyridium purpureum]|uniref:DUF547 domain-containing protein n=1 Tax=Porphyridium purpureum TaxID=35688 RepID=A0A5J4YYM4_PORPP|nr:hypothetical protein FVE85_2380 [Porphyridium purpureum]|eukprot:POR3831..scf209_3